MGILELILLAVGLSMDSFAVSVTSGVVLKKPTVVQAMKIALFFAVFQGTMPLIGWLAGTGFHHLISEYDHWIAFVLLLFLGGKMIVEGTRKGEEEPCCYDPSKTSKLIMLSLATSIDALAVGISFAFLKMNMCLPTIIIATVTLVVSLLGVYVGKYFGNKLRHSAEVLGGVILIGIGVKILIEHLYF